MHNANPLANGQATPFAAPAEPEFDEQFGLPFEDDFALLDEAFDELEDEDDEI